MELEESKKIVKKAGTNGRVLYDPNGKYQEACEVIFRKEGYKI